MSVAAHQEKLMTVLRGPHLSEKSHFVAEKNQFVFKVRTDATKAEIKKSVEQLFKVKVDNVNTLKVKGKMKRNRYGYSTKPTWKKAYVRLEQGQDIDFAVVE